MKKKYYIIAILFIVSFLLVYIFLPDASNLFVKTGNLYINEICSKNSSLIKDSDNDTSDYIELYNGYNHDINLLGYHLSDSEFETNKWTFPDVTIKAKSYLLIFASNKNKYINNEVHTNFSLSNNGEVITLSTKENNIISKITYQKVNADVSYGYNGHKYVYYYKGTPNVKNEGKFSNNPILLGNKNYKLKINEYMVDNSVIYDNDGNYNGFIEIYNNDNSDINLSNIYVSDSKSNTTKYQLPNIIFKSKSYLTIYTSNKDKYENNEIHANFKLSKNESIVISYASGEIIDSIDIVELPSTVSYGIKDNEWYYFPSPTPGYANTTSSFKEL